MSYLECTLNTPLSSIDYRCEELEAMGVSGFVIENEEDFRQFLENNHQYWDYVDEELENRYSGVSRIKFYLPDSEDGHIVLHAVKREYPELEVYSIQESDWENNWKNYYHPIPVGNRLVVVPEWEEIPSGNRLPLRLDPGLIFGTGSHPTTRMCLEALENCAVPGYRVLDLGCGSGILGIGALVLGCDSCLGCDIDPKASDVVMNNAALNGFGPEQIKVLAGDLLQDSSLRKNFEKGFDIVLANIVADVVIPLSAFIPDFVRTGGTYISSGIIDGRENEVQRAIQAAGFEILDHLFEEDWHCFVARKN